jgi:hypothetical protein
MDPAPMKPQGFIKMEKAEEGNDIYDLEHKTDFLTTLLLSFTHIYLSF